MINLNKEYLKFSFFVYLVNVCFIASLAQCFYFLRFYAKNPLINTVGYLSVIVVVITALFSTEFKNYYLKLIFNKISIKIALKLKEILFIAKEKYEYFCFVFIHLYIIFSLIHLTMIFFYQIDLSLEIFYQMLNLIRLLFSPLLLIVIGFSLYPNFLKMENIAGEATIKAIDQVTSQAIEFLGQLGNYKKNPKGALVLYAGGLTLMIGVGHKINLKTQFEDTTKKFGLDVAKVPECLIDDPVGQELYKSVLATASKVDQSALSILASDIKNFLSGQPTLREQIARDLTQFKASEALVSAKRQLSQSQADDISLSPLARRSTTDSELEPPSSTVTKIHSVFEKLFFDN